MSSETKSSDNLLRVKDVCSMLGIKRMTFYQLIKAGVLTAIDLNKGTERRPRYRVNPQSLRDYIKKQTLDFSAEK